MPNLYQWVVKKGFVLGVEFVPFSTGTLAELESLIYLLLKGTL